MTYDEAMTIQPRNIKEAAEAYRVLDFYRGPSARLKQSMLNIQIKEMLDMERGTDDNRNRDNSVVKDSYVLLQPDEVPDDQEPMPIQPVITEDKGSG